MKYLNYDELERLNNTMACMDTGDSRIFARIEAYSCKNTEDDRKLKALVEARYPVVTTQGHRRTGSNSSVNINIGSSNSTTPVPTKSNENTDSSGLLSTSGFSFTSPKSPFGPLDHPVSRKTFFYLLATLNAAFPDYDFSDLKPDVFMKLPSLSMSVTTVNNTLFAHLASSESEQKRMSASIWDAIETVINLQDCDIYSFNPDEEIEPEGENATNMWSFYFFFFNKKLKRILFMTARAVSFLAPAQPEELGIYNTTENATYSYVAHDKLDSSHDVDDDPAKLRRTLRDVGGGEHMEEDSSTASSPFSSDDENNKTTTYNGESHSSPIMGTRFGRQRRRASLTHTGLSTITDKSQESFRSIDKDILSRRPPPLPVDSSGENQREQLGQSLPSGAPYSREGYWRRSNSKSRRRATSGQRNRRRAGSNSTPIEPSGNPALDQYYLQYHANTITTRARSLSGNERGLSYEQYMMGEMEI